MPDHVVNLYKKGETPVGSPSCKRKLEEEDEERSPPVKKVKVEEDEERDEPRLALEPSPTTSEGVEDDEEHRISFQCMFEPRHEVRSASSTHAGKTHAHSFRSN